MINSSVTGFNELNAILTDLGAVLGKKATRSAAKKAMLPIKQEIEATSPFDTTRTDGVHIKDSFKLRLSGRTKKHQRTGDTTFLACSVYSADKEVNRYIAQVEFGRGAVSFKRNTVFGNTVNPFTQHLKEIKANPFMRTALRRNKTQVVETFQSGLVDEIEKIAKSKAKREARIKAKEKKANK